MATAEAPPTPLPTPQRKITFVPAKNGEIIKLGSNFTLRVMEDGSHTDNRLGASELILAPHSSGPPSHWHEMHDETFLVTKGTVRFHTTGLSPPAPDIDAHEGDYVVVPIKAPHTFSNPTDEEARYFNTFTPAFYVNYFKLMAELAEGGSLTEDIQKRAMGMYATMPVPGK